MTKIRVKFSFLFFNAIIFMFRDTEFISAFYIACISHELGHIIALRLTGGELKSIELNGSGIKMTASPYSSIKSGVLVLLSGVAVNFIFCIMLKLCGINNRLMMFNLAEGLFNLLPFSMLDGGAVLDLLAEGSVYESTIKTIISIIRIITAFIILSVLLYNAVQYIL